MMSTSPTLSARAQALIPALIALLVVVTLSPFADVIVPRMPLQLGDPQPRFALFGLLLASAPQVTLLLVVMAAVGLYGGYRLGVRIAAIFAIVTAIVYALLVPFFGLDFLQVRRLVNVEAKSAFDLAAMKTGAFAALMVPLLLWCGWLALQASKKDETATKRTKGQGLVVGQE